MAVLQQAIRFFGHLFRQHYGLSEAIQPETLLLPAEHVIEGTEKEMRRLASAGRAALGVELKVVNAQGKEVVPGEVGEIIIRGDHIMKGYWKLPEVTAATIRDGWLYTNDLATVDEDGFIYLVDRKDDLIISGGFNIYPREVEEVLYTHPAIREAVVFGVPDQEWGECVVAVVVLKEGKQATAEEIIAHCRANLAGYKKPRIVKFVDQLPQNASGKILRRELQRLWCEEQSEKGGEA
ncbi:MAG: hypothetical protein D6736_11660 [Nitrospinota bacterium]|nr:MAG: hypothetical protein D6736_11660 [Nitrospinota bacterium]